MEESRPSFRSSGGDRRLEIVSGKGFAGNQIYMTTRPEVHPVPSPMSRQAQVASPSVAAKPWGFNDAEMKRRKRIATYKVYGVEGRFKASIKNGFRWFKNKCSEIIHGY